MFRVNFGISPCNHSPKAQVQLAVCTSIGLARTLSRIEKLLKGLGPEGYPISDLGGR